MRSENTSLHPSQGLVFRVERNVSDSKLRQTAFSFAPNQRKLMNWTPRRIALQTAKHEGTLAVFVFVHISEVVNIQVLNTAKRRN
jgi:hypothetical protein